MGTRSILTDLNKPISAYPLAIFRIAFGLLMFGSQLRFLLKGWVEDLFLGPNYHFSYEGFEWVTVLPEYWMYTLVGFCALMALLVAIGAGYRVSIALFFLSFTYLELIDKVWYLNHYYFISLVAFLMIFIPANKVWSLDAYLRKEIWEPVVPRWSTGLIQLQLGMVYFFAGVAKLKYDWLIMAEPMKTWLAARTDFPLIGSFFTDAWVAYVFSWGGMLYDLSITFFLLSSRTRPWAYVAVWGFHVMTWLLFPIGMFPWIMIAATLIFFTEEDWKKVGLIKDRVVERITSKKFSLSAWQATLLGLYICIQVWLPLRHYAYPGDVLWNEQGFRFAWHVMVMEKNGMASYQVRDQLSEKVWTVYPSEYLIPAQERQMSFQPDMIRQFGEFLREEWERKGYPQVTISVKNRVCVNKICKSFSWEKLENIRMEK